MGKNDEPKEEKLSSMYTPMNKEVKSGARKDKRRFYDALAVEVK